MDSIELNCSARPLACQIDVRGAVDGVDDGLYSLFVAAAADQWNKIMY